MLSTVAPNLCEEYSTPVLLQRKNWTFTGFTNLYI